MDQNKKRVVLAYSGGLDTTYCLVHMTKILKYEVHTVLVNTGGFSDTELQETEKRAYEMGSAKHLNLNEKDNFYQNGIKYLIFGNVLKNNTYPLSVSAERIFQAMAIANYAKEADASAIVHGSTGAGNDQVRFDLIFNILLPEVEIITPIRDNNLTRQEEMDFLKSQGIELSWEKAKYSINKGQWGTSVGGAETLTSSQGLPDEAYPSSLTKEEEEIIELTFAKGELVGVGDKQGSPLEMIDLLESIASKFAIGRDIHVGDTIVGIKGRVGFEAAAPMIIIKAHELLEKHVLGKWQIYWKEQMANWYGMLLHEAQYLDPVMRDIEVFLESTQKHVTGTVRVKLAPHHFDLLGIISENDLMDSDFGTYGESNGLWSGQDVRGFTKILAVSQKIYHQKHGKDD